jgi:hypothetical protein
MKYDEILEGNKLIAEFLGFKVENIEDNIFHVSLGTWTIYERFKTDNENPYQYFLNLKTNIKNSTHFKFYSSWDWLMPVVEKIESIDKYVFDIYLNKCEIQYGNNFTIEEVSFSGLNKIEAVYKAVVAFIKWFNQQKQLEL